MIQFALLYKAEWFLLISILGHRSAASNSDVHRCGLSKTISVSGRVKRNAAKRTIIEFASDDRCLGRLVDCTVWVIIGRPSQLH